MCEVLDKSKLEEKESSNGLLKKITSPFSKKEPAFSAEFAWIQSTYGENTYKSIEKRILDKQDYIKRMIRSKFAPSPQENVVNYSSYHCVVDIEEDILKYVDDIFKPFSESGFEIINLSEECQKISEDGVYLISWKNIFKKK